LVSYPPAFAPALAIAYKWLSEHSFTVSTTVTSQYKKFFKEYKSHRKHSLADLETLLKFCRTIQAPVEWIRSLKEPELLMGERAVLTGCCTSLRLLFECKVHYSHEYFALIDYVVESKLAGPSVDGFVKMIKIQAIMIDKPWIELFQHYASIENTYSKHKTLKIGAQILGVLIKPTACSLAMEIVELSIVRNSCEEIKAVVKSNLAFASI
jgi:hypothetical protein